MFGRRDVRFNHDRTYAHPAKAENLHQLYRTYVFGSSCRSRDVSRSCLREERCLTRHVRSVSQCASHRRNASSKCQISSRESVGREPSGQQAPKTVALVGHLLGTIAFCKFTRPRKVVRNGDRTWSLESCVGRVGCEASSVCRFAHVLPLTTLSRL